MSSDLKRKRMNEERFEEKQIKTEPEEFVENYQEKEESVILHDPEVECKKKKKKHRDSETASKNKQRKTDKAVASSQQPVIKQEQEEELEEGREGGFVSPVVSRKGQKHKETSKRSTDKKRKKRKHHHHDKDMTPPLEEMDPLYTSHHKKLRDDFLKSLKEEGDEEGEEGESGDDMYHELHSLNYASQRHDRSCKNSRWNVQETKILKRNVRRYQKIHGIKDLVEWIKSATKTEKSTFYHSASKDINRSCFAVYRRLSRLIDDENYVGRWSEDMNEELLRLRGLHGNQWNLIGSHLGISGDLCRDHCRTMFKANKGVWSHDEETRLRQSLEERGVDLSLGDGSIPVDVSWQQVAQDVKTRSALQCRCKWTTLLSWKLQGGVEHWSSVDNIVLLETLAGDLEVEDEDEIDWARLLENWERFGFNYNAFFKKTIARTKYFLRQKWMALKRLVPRHLFKTYQECLEYLLTHHLPTLRKRNTFKT